MRNKNLFNQNERIFRENLKTVTMSVLKFKVKGLDISNSQEGVHRIIREQMTESVSDKISDIIIEAVNNNVTITLESAGVTDGENIMQFTISDNCPDDLRQKITQRLI